MARFQVIYVAIQVIETSNYLLKDFVKHLYCGNVIGEVANENVANILTN